MLIVQFSNFPEKVGSCNGGTSGLDDCPWSLASMHGFLSVFSTLLISLGSDLPSLHENCPPSNIATPVACSYIDDVRSYIRRAFKLLYPDFSAMIFSGTSALNILVMDVALMND